jgi:hypothetical protein
MMVLILITIMDDEVIIQLYRLWVNKGNLLEADSLTDQLPKTYMVKCGIRM